LISPVDSYNNTSQGNNILQSFHYEVIPVKENLNNLQKPFLKKKFEDDETYNENPLDDVSSSKF
jgi:hypothetical protein